MTARSTYPICEGFFLDANTKIETSSKDLGVDLGNIKTIRIIVLDADVTEATGSGTNATIRLYDNDTESYFYTITSADLAQNSDANGVYLAHVRGALFEGIHNVGYTYTPGQANGNTAGAITGFSVYIDAVENVA
jgi:hypothetical protein